MWAAQRLAGTLLLSRNCVRLQLFPFSAGKMPPAEPRLNSFASGVQCFITLGGCQLRGAEEPRNS